MSFVSALTTRYQKSGGTEENHADPELKTRYYKGKFNSLFESVEKVLKEDSAYTINSISADHGEISAELNRGCRGFVIITVITTKPFEIAVDFHISTERFSVTGIYPSLKQEILRFYEELNKKNTYIGSGVNGQK
ncbi:hypothetical protein [Mesobacillus harenae]|uniref:hypothetical protein n=1 Tax=Mesobacillus harenae TaxID=2213203 RepID=UPI0015801B88|nr:hypothetical protein [Mesobacillus harenae]